MRIIAADLADRAIVAMLHLHLTRAQGQTAPGSAHALDLSGLQAPGIRLFAAWEGEALLGMGALKQSNAQTGEVKSMYVADAARRGGVGQALLRHIVQTARALGFVRLNLETGSWPYFRPAHALYRGFGFTDCAAFPPYLPDPNSLFMTLVLPEPLPPA